MGGKWLPRSDIKFGDIILTLNDREIEFLKIVAEGGVRPSHSVGGPQSRLCDYLRDKLGIKGNPTALYCRVAFGAGLVGLIPADCVKGAE